MARLSKLLFLLMVLGACEKKGAEDAEPNRVTKNRSGKGKVRREAPSADFSGKWATVTGAIEFTQEGHRVSGTWRLTDEDVNVKGIVAGHQLTYTFDGPESEGAGYLRILKDDTRRITGTYTFKGLEDYPMLHSGRRIGSVDGDLPSALIEALVHDDVITRHYAAISLGTSGTYDEKAIPVLVDALKSSESLTKGMAALALGQMGPEAKGAVPQLIATLKDKKATVRGAATAGLSGIGPAAVEAVPALIETLKDETPDVRWSAAEALGDIGPTAREAVPYLSRLLRDEDSTMVYHAAASLGLMETGTKEAVPILVGAVKEAHGEYKLRAVRALGGLGPVAKEAIPTLTNTLGDEALKEAAEEALKGIREQK